MSGSDPTPTSTDAGSVVTGTVPAGSWQVAPGVGRLRFYGGVMGQGKSALALQLAHHRRAAGRPGLLLTRDDRAGGGRLTSRLGIGASASEFDATTDLGRMVLDALPPRGYVIVDEAQFLTESQVDQLAWVVDEHAIDVDCFGLVTAFDSRLFPGSRRLIELADETIPLQVEVMCWCGAPGRINSRVERGAVARNGGQVAVGDLGDGADVTYQVLCRRHWRDGDLGPHAGDVPLPLLP